MIAVPVGSVLTDPVPIAPIVQAPTVPVPTGQADLTDSVLIALIVPAQTVPTDSVQTVPAGRLQVGTGRPGSRATVAHRELETIGVPVGIALIVLVPIAPIVQAPSVPTGRLQVGTGRPGNRATVAHSVLGTIGVQLVAEIRGLRILIVLEVAQALTVGQAHRVPQVAVLRQTAPILGGDQMPTSLMTICPSSGGASPARELESLAKMSMIPPITAPLADSQFPSRRSAKWWKMMKFGFSSRSTMVANPMGLQVLGDPAGPAT